MNDIETDFEGTAEQRRAIVTDSAVVVLVADATDADARALQRLLDQDDAEALDASDLVAAVLPLQEPLRQTPTTPPVEPAKPAEPVRAEVPSRRLITGPPPAASAGRPARVEAEVDAATMTVEQTQTVESTLASEPDDHAFDETVGSAAELDPLDADTLTAAGESPVVARPSAADPAAAPTVLTVLCATGHVQRIGVAQCGVCQGAIEPGSEAMRPRPEFVAASIPGRERIPLGRGAVFGRRPRSSRMQGVRVPHLVTLSSPNEDISRSHLEIRLEDWSVLAVDLGSTNGTMLLREDRAPLRLRAGVATNVDFGDRLDVGEGVIITLEEL
ncbi:FHA domain-containing protein [Agrococcus casei]|uniref:FHA domain-containing protein n=1 Tax=Agrococcus casei TaxID=343512 RepID=UPI003F8F4AC8